MTQVLKDVSTEDLVELFTENCSMQDDALLRDKITEFNQLYDQMATIRDELKSRKPDARIALRKLYDHPNLQVRLQAARLSLAVAPIEARQVIEDISKTAWMPQAADAKGTLRNLDSGFFKPT